MEKTRNYQLNQWAAGDKVQRVDFNADNAKIDAAIKAVDAKADTRAAQTALDALAATVSGHTSALAGKGNCQIAAGTYTGTGKYSSASPTSLTFPFQPKLVAIQNRAGATPETEDSSYFDYMMMVLVWPVAQYRLCNGRNPVTITWSGNKVSWYAESAPRQLNALGRIYHYVALG